MQSPAEAATTIAEEHFGDSPIEPDYVVLTRAKARITRDLTTTFDVDVYLHEMPILQKIHHPDNVRELSRHEVKVAGFNQYSEGTRLQSLYDTNTDKYVESTFGNDIAEKIAQIQKLNLDSRPTSQPERSIQKSRDRGDVIRQA